MNRHARDKAQKRIPKTNMTNAETNAIAGVAEQGATVAPEKASSKKGASQKKGGSKGRKTANGGKTNAVQKKPAKAGKKASRTVRAKEASRVWARIRTRLTLPPLSTFAFKNNSRGQWKFEA
jgi:hypothetical protein